MSAETHSQYSALLELFTLKKELVKKSKKKTKRPSCYYCGSAMTANKIVYKGTPENLMNEHAKNIEIY